MSSPTQNKSPVSKHRREDFREMRRKRQQRQRIAVVAVIIGIALLAVAAVTLPGIQKSMQPTPTAGAVTMITPLARANADGKAMGNPNAKVKIEVWEDFQCPACAQYTENTEMQIVANYVNTDKVYYIFRQFPFIDGGTPGKGGESDQAANASMCALEQGRFWDYHDMLFINWKGENEGNLSDSHLLAFAEALGLDMTKFKSCFSENRYYKDIEADFVAGKAAGVDGTPSVFVNGQIVKPGYLPSYEDVQKVIEAELAK
jgi:protein-disulfide isomerase